MTVDLVMTASWSDDQISDSEQAMTDKYLQWQLQFC
jgi:hypothetical protein